MMRCHRFPFVASTFVCLLFSAISSYGAGLTISELSAKGQGEAFAGNSTERDDASCAFFNPAGMSLMEQSSVSAGATLLRTSFEFTKQDCFYPQAGNMPVTGDDGGPAGSTSLLPSMYYSQKIDPKTALGFSVNVPFGLSSDYDDEWVGRYQNLYAELQTVNFNPSVGRKLSDYFSVGAGLNLQYLTADLQSAIDFGSILAAQGVPGATPQSLDGKVKVKGDDWGWGYNAGLIVTPMKGTAVGLTYRSEIAYTLEGDASFTVPSQAEGLQSAGLFTDTDIQSDITMPESISLGVAQKLSTNLTLKSEILWTRWSRHQELRIQYDSNQPDSVTDEQWQDVFRYALGMNYAFGPKWVFRIGTAYDESPVKNAQYRHPAIPDSNRIWLSCGAGYRVTERIGLDMAYTRIYFNVADMDSTGATGDRVQGYYDDAHFDSISLQLSYLF